MKLLFYSLVLILTPGLINAQINFNVILRTTYYIFSVANGKIYYDFTWGDDQGMWAWGSPDFNIPGTFVQDTLMFVDDGTPGINEQGNPIAQEACYPLINDLSGKIAVCWRNVCSFYDKAIHAQEAGAVAVIIINRFNELDEISPGGPEGLDVTIPVTYIMFDDGMAIADAMQNGPVVVFIGNGSAGIVSLEFDVFFGNRYSDLSEHLCSLKNHFEFNWPENLGLKDIQLYNTEGNAYL